MENTMFGITVYTALIFGAGLLVGWNVLPQPVIVRKYYDIAVAYVKEKFNKED